MAVKMCVFMRAWVGVIRRSNYTAEV